jgi:radical SAM family uncharacterized protein/radical SAM-linked protein
VSKRDQLLSQVERPARYLGGESGCVLKDPDQVRLSLALAFPEIYEIAMSHLGLKVLYESLAARPEIAAERVFCPWVDLMDLMGDQGEEPWSLESGRPLSSFDVIGFSLQYELTYTNLLHMLRLSGVPLLRTERGPDDPLVIAGGPCMVNPEPMADFLDLAVVGEAEELIHPLIDLLLLAKAEGWDRAKLYHQASGLEGVYAPALYEPRYANGRLMEVKALDPERPKVRRRVVPDMSTQPPPIKPVMPAVRPVHDRLGLEVARGCTRGCRFCQAGYIYRPVRERPAQQVLDATLAGLKNTGLEEVALLSLSTSDYSCVEPLAAALMDILVPRRVSLSLPSLRMDSLSEELIKQIKRVRKTGFTLAPEAGSQRLRSLINKNLDEKRILATAQSVFSLGWNRIKLYFMLGLPTENDEDIEAIGRLCSLVATEARAAGRGRGKRPVVNASLGLFVPKPHTPFQWEEQMGLDEAWRRVSLAKKVLNGGSIKVKWHHPASSVIEGVISRGDRRLGPVLVRAMELGCRFDGWSEHLDYEAWLKALEGAGLSTADYLRPRDHGEVLPWDHIDVGVGKEFLLDELKRALAGEATGDCRDGHCLDCGVCDHQIIKPRIFNDPAIQAPPEPQPGDEREKYRLRLEKTGPARYLGHLETMKQLERAWRRAGVELAYTQGYHPHALVKTASALPLGVESLVEVLEVTTSRPYLPAELERMLNPVLPQGLTVADARLAKPGEKLLEPVEVTYRVRPAEPLDPSRLEAFHQAEQWTMLRVSPKGKREIDLKAAVHRLELDEEGLLLSVGRAGGRPKPAEVLENIFKLSPAQAQASRALRIEARY